MNPSKLSLQSRKGEFQLGKWRVYPEAGLLVQDELQVHVEPKLMDVLACLAQANGGVVTREVLLETVWPRVVVNEDVLTRAVSELRTLLGDVSRERQYIATIPKRGYKLLLNVEPIQHNEVTGDIVSIKATEHPQILPPSVQRNRLGILGRTLHQSMAAVGYLLVVFAGYQTWVYFDTVEPLREQVSRPLNATPEGILRELQELAQVVDQNGVASEQLGASTRIMVQALVTITDDARTRIFAAGLGEDIKHALSMQPALRVVSQIQQDVLATDLILSGSVRIYESHARINLQLTEAVSARLVWSRSFETTLENTLEAQANIANLISQVLSAQIQV